MMLARAICLFALAPLAMGQVVVEPNYADQAAVREAWRAQDKTPQAQQVQKDGAPAIHLPLVFAGNEAERCYWDLPVSLDLSLANGLQFDVRCDDLAAIGWCTLYLKSGAGWYSLEWSPEVEGDWSTVALERSAARVEGEPAGWTQIEAIRFSLWRGDGRNSDCWVRNLRVTGGGAITAILRASGEGADAAASMSGLLSRVGLESVTLAEGDATPERLARFKVVVLPHNPTVSAEAVAALRSFTEQGGKLLLCYSVDPQVAQLAGLPPATYFRPEDGSLAYIAMRPGALPGAPARAAQASWNLMRIDSVGDAKVLADWLNADGQPTGWPALIETPRAMWLTHVLLPDGQPEKDNLARAMLGALAPEAWQEIATNAVAKAGVLGRYKTLDDAQNALTQRGLPGQTLTSARRLDSSAKEALAAGRWQEALDLAAQTRQEARDAWATSQPAAPDQFRAWWCHSAAGVAGLTWDEAIKQLKDNGFNAIIVNMLWGGVSYGRSELLPMADPNVDRMAECLAACRKYGVAMHMWKVNWNTGSAVPDAFLAQMRSEHRLQADADGKEEPWLCPSDPRNQQLEIDSMVEVARLYDVDGLHFDYIRYPDSNHCYCDGCRQRFSALTGDGLADWPQAVQRGGRLRQAWLDWRRENINAVVQAVSEQARAVRPGVKISAAVFPNWPSDRDGVGQDWALWCQRGWVDFVCPMDYTPINSQFQRRVTSQLEWAAGVPVYPGIGASATGIQMSPEEVMEQIEIARSLGTKGFVIFNYGLSESRGILPYLGMGITKPTPPNG